MSSLPARLRARPYVWTIAGVVLALFAACVVLAGSAVAHEHHPVAALPARTVASEAQPRAGAKAVPSTGGRIVATAPGRWLAAWGASPQAASIADPGSLRGFQNATLRQIVFASAAGTMVRVRFTDAFGSAPLFIARASVARAGLGASLAPGTARQLLFGGRPSVLIPAGASVLSDPVSLAVPALSRLAISLFVPDPTGPATQHASAHEFNYVANGSHVIDPSPNPYRRTIPNWYFLDAVDTYSPLRDVGTVVALGDSITAGVGSSTDADANWPDDLARRLQALPGDTLGVVDEGIGGNRVLNDSECCGISAVARFAPDVLSQMGVRDVILLEGVNDIGYSQKHTADTLPHTNVSAADIIAGDESIIAQARAAGVRIFGATILPFEGARYWTPAGELKREAVNHWILTSGAFDGVIDFDSVMADPRNPLRLNPAYDSGDHLHPNDAGYAAMASVVPLSMLVGSPS